MVFRLSSSAETILCRLMSLIFHLYDLAVVQHPHSPKAKDLLKHMETAIL